MKHNLPAENNQHPNTGHTIHHNSTMCTPPTSHSQKRPIPLCTSSHIHIRIHKHSCKTPPSHRSLLNQFPSHFPEKQTLSPRTSTTPSSFSLSTLLPAGTPLRTNPIPSHPIPSTQKQTLQTFKLYAFPSNQSHPTHAQNTRKPK